VRYNMSALFMEYPPLQNIRGTFPLAPTFMFMRQVKARATRKLVWTATQDH